MPLTLPTLPAAFLAAIAHRNSVSAGISVNTVAANSIADALAKCWLPSGYATSDFLAAQGTSAVVEFTEHGAMAQHLWTYAPAILAASCKAKGITVTDDGHGAPVFSCVKGYSPVTTGANAGSITSP